MLSFFFSIKQMSFPSIYFSIFLTKHIWEKTKFFISSHFSISSPIFKWEVKSHLNLVAKQTGLFP